MIRAQISEQGHFWDWIFRLSMNSNIEEDYTNRNRKRFEFINGLPLTEVMNT